LALAVAIGLGVIGGLAAPASAHATLESTNPPAGGVVAKSPGEVVLHFDQEVETEFGSVEVYNSSSKRVDDGSAHHVPGDSHSVEVGVPKTLSAGGYVVTWRVISADSHPVHGAFTFFIGSGASGNVNAEATKLLAQGAGSTTVGVIFGVDRFLAFVAAALLIGGALFVGAIWTDGRSDRRARAIVWTGWGALLVTTAAAFALQGPYGGGLPLAKVTDVTVLKAVWHTRFGHMYAARLVFLVAGAFVVERLLRATPPARVLKAIGAVLGVAILATWGLAGHPATGSLVPIALPFDVIHIGAASIWAGGLAMVLLAVLPASRGERGGAGSPLRTALPAFSQWALGAVIAILITGAFAAWHQVGLSWGALTTTAYGRLVAYKILAFAALICLAFISRSTVHGPGLGFRRNPGPPAAPEAAREPVLSRGPGAVAADPDAAVASRLRRAVGAEALVILVVFAFTAILVSARPADQAYAAPFSTEVKAGPTLVNAVVDPAKAGPLTIHVYILTPEGAQDPVPEVDGTLSDKATGISGLTVPFVNAGPGHFLTNGFAIPIRGTWVLQIEVRTDAIDEYYATPITVHIH
jgi:copper transport protein